MQVFQGRTEMAYTSMQNAFRMVGKRVSLVGIVVEFTLPRETQGTGMLTCFSLFKLLLILIEMSNHRCVTLLMHLWEREGVVWFTFFFLTLIYVRGCSLGKYWRLCLFFVLVNLRSYKLLLYFTDSFTVLGNIFHKL